MHKYIWYMLDDSEARTEKAVSAPHYKESEGVAHDLPRGVECWLCGVFHCLPWYLPASLRLMKRGVNRSLR